MGSAREAPPAPSAELDAGAAASESDSELAERVREAFEAEDFREEIWQKPERGMVFGMIRREGDMQLHVRFYRDGHVMAERELSHHYLEHLISPRESAHDEVQRLLEKHDLDHVEVREKEFPKRMTGNMPRTRTPWKPLVAGIGFAVVGAVLGGRAFWPGGED